MAESVALFPLDYVLLPGVPLPLHIFEPCYRQLVTDVGSSGSFGVVLGHRGSRQPAEPVPPSRRTPGPDGRPEAPVPELAGVGTLAEIIESEPLADGRFDLLTAGTRRFRILEIDTVSQPYLRAQVEYLDEPAGIGAFAALQRARPLSKSYLDRLAELVDHTRPDELTDDPARASYEIAARMQLTTADRQILLATATAADRLRVEIRLLRRELILLDAIRAVPVPAQALHLPAGLN